MILSLIIPTYNEEEYLPVLLESIKQQDFSDYEIIVADADSKDNTVKIAEEYGCIVVEGGMPAVGRNNGAKVAKGDYLLFLDSDLKLTEDYLAKVIYEFKMERLGIAITQMKPLSKKTEDKLLHDLANLFMISVEKIKPHGAGCYGIIAKRELHERCGGFNEELTFGEDTEYIERLAKKERFKVLRNAKIGVSTRRLEEEGLATLAKQYGKSTVNDFLGIRTEASDLNYGFDHGKEYVSKHKLDKIALESEKLDQLKNSYDESKQKINTAKVYLKKVKKTKIRDKKVIFYCICGEGMGHAIRSSVIIDRIKDKYDVYIFSSDRAYKYLNEKFDNVYKIGGFNTVYINNKVSNTKTLINALKRNPLNIKEGYEELYKKARKQRKNANPSGRVFSLPFSFLLAKLFFRHGLDPLPMPDEVEQQADHHDIAAVGMDICDNPLDGTSIAETGKQVKVEHDARGDADKTAEEEQQVEIKILFHRDPSFCRRYFTWFKSNETG